MMGRALPRGGENRVPSVSSLNASFRPSGTLRSLSGTTTEKRVRTKYGDPGPTLANEKLAEVNGIGISTFALRGGMIQAGRWKAGKQKSRHRAWRERRACLEWIPVRQKANN